MDLAPDQIRDGLEIGDVVKLEDVAGEPGLPAVDGRQLLNLPIGSIPGQFQLGSPLLYFGTGGFTANEVQYTRVWLPAGSVLDRMRCYIGNITGPDKDIRMGIYSQTDPSDSNGLPNTRVAQTNAVEADEGAVNEVALTSVYTVTTAGWYWLAIVRSSGGGQFNIGQTPDSAPAGFLSPLVRYESTASTVLPATAGVTTSPAGSVIYVATMEQ